MKKHLLFACMFSIAAISLVKAGPGNSEQDKKEIKFSQLQIIDLISKPGSLTARFSDVMPGIALIHILDPQNHRLISRENYSVEGTNNWEINTSILSSGNYICEVVCNGSIERKGFTIE